MIKIGWLYGFDLKFTNSKKNSIISWNFMESNNQDWIYNNDSENNNRY
jgi:hypothetical protein